ncbi:ester cyclase [Streptomyces hoynatensis]|uniref:SnoaL-like domain-containing protein n=1 Tax=Streptomyces hoynatensis TaxID=1141874 RepID=A0A3A9YUU7_9ACTN|nr:ester cyclase [Streptomyces hoynatensis]RKN39559.1 hypothetical protein D7294_20945 [Streptomyces hoynatensis]
MRLFVAQVQQAGRFELIDSLVHPDYRNHTAEPGQGRDREGVRATTRALHAAFSGLTVRILHCVGEGDLVATHKVFRARHTGPWFHLHRSFGSPGEPRPPHGRGSSRR